MPTNDPYWSRHADAGALAERPDPVLWDEAPGPLDAEAREAFARDGYLLQPGLLGPQEVADLLQEAHRLGAVEVPDPEQRVLEPGGEAVRSVFRVHDLSPRFAEVAADPRLAGVARQLLGGEVYVHQSRINFKPGFDGEAFFWHSDFETWHMEDGMPRPRAVSASLLLTENNQVNGPLMVIPGSHRRYVRCRGETPEDHYKESLRDQRVGVPAPEQLRRLVDEGGIRPLTGPAGSVVFFDCNLMHGSAGNLSPFPRHNLFLVFNSAENRLVEPFAGTPPRPDFLGARSD